MTSSNVNQIMSSHVMSFALSGNGEESFKKLLDPDLHLDLSQNVNMTCDLSLIDAYNTFLRNPAHKQKY